MNFRLIIDIPLSEAETEAADKAQRIVQKISSALIGEGLVQYRMANDNDRTIRNYLMKDQEGHATTKKCKLEL